MLSETRKQLTQTFMICSIKPLSPEALEKRLMEIFEAETQPELINRLSAYVANAETLEVVKQRLENIEVDVRHTHHKITGVL
jgi:hypothetical protein